MDYSVRVCFHVQISKIIPTCFPKWFFNLPLKNHYIRIPLIHIFSKTLWTKKMKVKRKKKRFRLYLGDKSRDITLSTKVHLVKAKVFPVVMYGCENCTIKKAGCQRIDAFELWCWRRLLRVPWTARRSNQPILKKISPGCSLEGLMLKLNLQYFGHLMRRADSLEKALMLGKIEGRRRRGQ